MSDTPKHTPGPWVRGEYPCDNLIRGADGDNVADTIGLTSRPRAECAANAEFIVRAVNAHADLLAALEALLTGGSAAKWEAARKLARAAIAKAKGGAA